MTMATVILEDRQGKLKLGAIHNVDIIRFDKKNTYVKLKNVEGEFKSIHFSIKDRSGLKLWL